MKRLFVVSITLISGLAVAQENCGYKISDQRSGFEAGEQSDFVPLPPESTPLSLVISSPTEGEVVPLDQVQVFGSLTGPSNTGVMVSNELAWSNASQFTIRPISLVPGANVITVVAKTLDGGTVTATRNITATPSLGA